MITKYGLEMNKRKHPVLVKEASFLYDDQSFNNPEKLVEMMNELFNLNKKAEEHLYMCSFDTKMNVLAVFEIAHGTINMAPASSREIAIRALISGASSIIILHNHPSMDMEPSRADIHVFEEIKNAMKLINIALLDFIILGAGYYSFRQNGYYEKSE